MRKISERMKLFSDLPSRKETSALLAFLAAWMTETCIFMELRPEHFVITALVLVFFFISRYTRKMAVAMLPFVLFGISYDLMRIVPNYEVNPIDVRDIYEAEKSLFGVATAQGVLTPNEYFQIHNSPVMDFMAGVFYLCWVPVPMLFGLWLFFTRQHKTYLHFSMVFLFVNLLGYIGYYIHPAAPPWYIMKHGFEPIINTMGDIAGLVKFEQMTGWNVFDAIYARNANIFAAVPSLHSAYMTITFAYSFRSRCGNFVRCLFAVIMCGIWFTAVYTSHHYIIDVVLGIICAAAGIILFEKGLMRIPCFNRFMRNYARYIE